MTLNLIIVNILFRCRLISTLSTNPNQETKTWIFFESSHILDFSLV